MLMACGLSVHLGRSEIYVVPESTTWKVLPRALTRLTQPWLHRDYTGDPPPVDLLPAQLPFCGAKWGAASTCRTASRHYLRAPVLKEALKGEPRLRYSPLQPRHLVGAALLLSPSSAALSPTHRRGAPILGSETVLGLPRASPSPEFFSFPPPRSFTLCPGQPLSVASQGHSFHSRAPEQRRAMAHPQERLNGRKSRAGETLCMIASPQQPEPVPEPEGKGDDKGQAPLGGAAQAAAAETHAGVPRSTSPPMRPNPSGVGARIRQIVEQYGGLGPAVLLSCQLVCWLLFLAPPETLMPQSLPSDILDTSTITFSAGMLLAVSLALGLSSFAQLGRGFSAAPRPSENASLRTAGPYAWVRHPMYSAHILLFLSVALLTQSTARLAVTMLTVVCLYAKARAEEDLLVQRFGEQYNEYRKKVVSMLVPYLL